MTRLGAYAAWTIYGLIAWIVSAGAMLAPVFAQDPNDPINSTQSVPVPTAQWVSTRSLLVPRANHTATLLHDGSVLIVGGAEDRRSELYDPVTNTFGSAALMQHFRFSHTATLLQDGRVLVAGGYDQLASGEGGYFRSSGSAELYDPATNTWAATGSLPTWRTAHTATLLLDGRVLIVGGSLASINSTTGEAHLYDPATGTWARTGALGGKRIGHSANLLPDGRVMVTGGISAEQSDELFASTALYDPITGTWSRAGDLAFGMADLATTDLIGGNVLAAGGFQDSVWGSSQVSEVFNPATAKWTRIADLKFARTHATATRLLDGNVLVAGGFRAFWEESGVASEVAAAELYDVNEKQWLPAGNMVVTRYSHTATLLKDGKVLVTGGVTLTPDGGGRALDSAELYGIFPAGTIVPAFTGSWFDPAQNGHGLLVEVLPNRHFLAAWFAFNAAGTQQAWFIGVGTYDGNTATINNVFQPTGGRWIPNFDPTHVVKHPWGALKFTFTDCTHGKVEFVSSAGYGTGNMNLTRLTQPAGLTCP